MPKKRKKLTQAQKDYRKERKRIQRFMRNAEKRGFIFQEDILPPTPKRITKASVKKLKKLTPNVLYQRAGYVNPATGQFVSGTLGRKIERSVSATKGYITRQKKQARLQKIRDEVKEETDRILKEVKEQIESENEQYEYEQDWKDDYDTLNEDRGTVQDYIDTEWQAPPTSAKEPPDVDIIEQIRAQIRALPERKYERKKTIFIDEYKHMLESLLDDRVILAENIDQLTEYTDYLRQHESEIFEKLEERNLPSIGSDVYQQLISVANIIKGKALSPTESKEFESFLDFYENYELPI